MQRSGRTGRLAIDNPHKTYRHGGVVANDGISLHVDLGKVSAPVLRIPQTE
jgi:hypothetical protein